jgi:DNA-binding GntR family transcriptional regulator
MTDPVLWLYAEPLADVIYRKLRRDIGDSVYEPGARLVQDQVAENLGVSPSGGRTLAASHCAAWSLTAHP